MSFVHRVRVERELPPATDPRPARIGDVVRDRHFPRAIDIVTGFAPKDVLLRDDGRCLTAYFHVSYEHADGAPIVPVRGP